MFATSRIARLFTPDEPHPRRMRLIRHVAMFRWKESADGPAIQAFATGLSAMPGAIPEILRYEHGDDLQLSPGNADYVLVADFATVEDYRTYAQHPDHVEFIENRVKPILESISRVQYHLP